VDQRHRNCNAARYGRGGPSRAPCLARVDRLRELLGKAQARQLAAWGIVSKEGRWHVAIRPVPHLDQGSRSRQHCRATGEER
jgi:hypothetical protein